MKRILILALALVPSFGCMFKAVGPLAGKGGTPVRSSTNPNAIATAPKDIAAMPVIPDAPPPPAPLRTVNTGDVTPETAHDAATKLRKELQQDRAATEAMPNYTEVSRIPANGR